MSDYRQGGGGGGGLVCQYLQAIVCLKCGTCAISPLWLCAYFIH